MAKVTQIKIANVVYDFDLVDGSLNTAKIADEAVTSAKLSSALQDKIGEIDGKITNPSGGQIGQVLTKTIDGEAWTNSGGGGGCIWGSIEGDLEDQTDLATALAPIATFGDIVTHNASEFATPSDIGNGMLTIMQNGVVIGTFAANASTAAVIELINTIYDDTDVKNRLVELEDPVSSVIAAALTLLESRVSAIEKQAREGFPSLIVDELEVRRKFNQYVSAGNSYLRGAGAPAAAVIPVDWDEANFGPWTGIPQFIGQRYLNTSSNKWYTAKGFRAISDWVQDTNA